MAKIKDSIEDSKNLINEELDYLYHKEQELLLNLNDVMELRQDLLNSIKDDLKKLSDLYKEEVIDETSDCAKCGEECGNKLIGDEVELYCSDCNNYN